MKKFMSDYVKVGMGFERLFIFGLVFFMLCHLCTCLWIIMATLINEEDYSQTWVEGFTEENELHSGVYMVAFYWTITTITTVGYGDISGTNNPERAFCCLVMIIGVISFSFANGTLAAILSSTDNANAIMQERMNLLNKINDDYKLPQELFSRIKRNMNVTSAKNYDDVNKFIAELPHKLRISVSQVIFHERYSQMKFFAKTKRSPSFVAWMCPLLHPSFFEAGTYVFEGGDLIEHIYFSLTGSAHYVIP